MATRRKRREWLPAAIAVGVLAVGATVVEIALHPARLLSQARRVGVAPAAMLPGYVPPGNCRWCEAGTPGSSVGDAGEGFPFEATLPDGRRIALVLRALAWDAANYDNAPEGKNDPAAHGGILYLVSANAPDQTRPKVGAFPKEMDSLLGVTDDHRVFGGNLRGAILASTSLKETAKGGPISAPLPIATPTPAQAPATLELVQMGVLDNPAPLSRFTAVAPRVGVPSKVAVAPTGDRLVWVFPFLRSPYAPVAWAAHYLPFLGPYAEKRDALAVWVTGLHGENPVRIGEENAPMAKSTTSATLPAHFSWKPDGRAIRFVDGGQIFEVPVVER